MSKPLLCFCLSVFLSIFTAFAQTKGSIKGKLTDSLDKTPLEFATVAVTDPVDSSLISYTLSLKDGSFNLRNLPADKEIKLNISFVGYLPFRRSFALQRGETRDLGNILLNRRTLKEVIVTSDRQPITIKKDTIEFSPEAFKTRPNAVLEDLLKKLPGLQIDLDGTITVNGKKVKKITIDGKDFFASDLSIASKNINVDLIDKLQVMDDREDDPDKLKDASQVEKVINLKMKKAIKKSAFGKIYAGGGSSGRFESGALLNIFRDTLQVSLIGFGNNVNRSAFTNSELGSMGGFDRSGGTSGTGINFGGRSWGLQQIGSAGFNLNYDLKKKLKLNLMYFYGNTVNDQSDNGASQTFIGDTTLSSISDYRSTQTVNKHNINAVVDWKPDTLTSIKFQPKVTLSLSNSSSVSNSDNSNTAIGKISQSSNLRSGEDNGRSYEHRLNYYHRFRNKKDHSISVTNNVRINPRSVQQFTNGSSTFFITSKDSILNQKQVREESSNSASMDIYYRYPITKKIVSDISISASYDDNPRLLDLNRYNASTEQYDLRVAGQSSDVKRLQWTYLTRPGITWNFTKTKSLRVAAAIQTLSQSNRFYNLSQQVERSFFNIFPSIRLSTNNWSVNYDVSMRHPGINDLTPVTIVYSPLYAYTGNPALKSTITYSGNIYHNKFIASSQIGYSAYFMLNYDKNNTTWAEFTDANKGSSSSTPINFNGYYSQSYINFNKRFKKSEDLQFRIFSGLNGYYRTSPFVQNNVSDTQHAYDIALRSGFGAGYKELIQYEPSYSVNRNINRYEVRNDRNRSSFSHNLNNQLFIRWPKKVIVEVNHSYNYDSQITAGYRRSSNVLNASLSLQMLKKDRGQLKLSGFDLLDQNTGNYSWVGNSYFSTGSQLVLHRYFMMSYVFNFNKTTTK